MINSSTGARRGDNAIYVMNDEWHKKKCLYIFEPPNQLVHCATFRTDEMADEFMKTLYKIVGLEEE